MKQKHLISGLVFAFLAMLLFLKLSEDLVYNELYPFDLALTTAIQGIRNPILNSIFIGITQLGSPLVVIAIGLITVVLISLHKGKAHYFMVLSTLGGSAIFNELLKLGFHRPRPNIARLVNATGYSFPSGHAMISVSLYGLLAYLVWRNYPRWSTRLLSLALCILILLIGLSRVYLGVHYPSDVLAGFAAGAFWLTICIFTSKSLAKLKAKKG